MVIASQLAEEIAVAIRRTLLPQRFPVRRDLEIEAGIHESESCVSFFDHFWVDQEVLAAAAVRIPRRGLAAALEASALRQLLRALVVKIEASAAVLKELAVLGGTADFDAALLRVDVTSGAASAATMGMAAVELAGGAKSVERRLRPGNLVWLTAGPISGLPSEAVPVQGLRKLIEPALAASQPGAGCAVLYKSAASARRRTTFVVPNAHEEIPALLEKVAAFFSRLGLRKEAVAGIDLALDELLSNCISYGFRDGNAHEILMSVADESGRLLIEIQDDGAPFDPLSIPPPDISATLEERQIGGLGMHFVRSLLDSVNYRRSNGWNVLTLEKRLTAGEDDRS